VDTKVSFAEASTADINSERREQILGIKLNVYEARVGECGRDSASSGQIPMAGSCERSN
jgi:hypothetical protein